MNIELEKMRIAAEHSAVSSGIMHNKYQIAQLQDNIKRVQASIDISQSKLIELQAKLDELEKQ